MSRRLVALLVALFAVAGCVAYSAAQPSGFRTGSTVHRLAVGHGVRTYRLYIPANLPAAAPLVVMLHGGFGSAEQAERAYGWDQLADSAKFVVAYPDGVLRAWNAGGGCCGFPARSGVDDVGFVSAVVGDVGANVGIDRRRIYATGMSNGALMSYALACATDVFAAIGPVAGTQLAPCSSPRPTSVAHIHGTADRMVPYDGSRGEGVAHIDGPSIPEVDAFWRNVDQCATPVVTTTGTVTTAAAACQAGRAVTLLTVDGGGHDWPPFATSALWQFFAGRQQ